jgi:hypothetical protein
LRDIQPIQQGPNPNLSDRNLGIPLNEVEDHVTTVVLKYLAKVVGTFLSTSASLFGLSFFRPEKGKLGKEPLAFLAFSLWLRFSSHNFYLHTRSSSISREIQLFSARDLFRTILWLALLNAFASYICLVLGLTIWLGESNVLQELLFLQ